MTNWTLAPSIETLRNQVNQIWPNRDKASDGTIGDLRHQHEVSDHNPNSHGVVTAWDCDSDLSPTVNVSVLVDALQKSKDQRIKYLIFNRQITVKGDISKWKRYTGIDPHINHLHLSVSSDPASYNNASEWHLDFDPKAQRINTHQEVRDLMVGMTGTDVAKLQNLLKIPVDGVFGPATLRAVKDFQVKNNLRMDGIAGTRTKEELNF